MRCGDNRSVKEEVWRDKILFLSNSIEVNLIDINLLDVTVIKFNLINVTLIDFTLILNMPL